MGFFSTVCGAIYGTIARVVGIISAAIGLGSPSTRDRSIPINTGYRTSAYDYLSSGYNSIYSYSTSLCEHLQLTDFFQLTYYSSLEMKPLNEYQIPHKILAIQSNESTEQQLQDLRCIYMKMWYRMKISSCSSYKRKISF